MTRHVRKNPGNLHLLACYVLFCLTEEITANSALNNVQKNNRLVYELILFLCGDALRSQAEQNFGLQTKVVAPSKRVALWLITHQTIQCVIKQCLEQGWLLPPSGNILNYTLTTAGEEMISPLIRGNSRELHDERSAALFTPANLQIIRGQVKLLLVLPKIKLDEEVRKAFKRAYKEPALVAHYDLTDPALIPFLTGNLAF